MYNICTYILIWNDKTIMIINILQLQKSFNLIES